MRYSAQSTTIPKQLPELITVLLENRGVVDRDAFFSPPHPMEISSASVGITATELKKAKKIITAAITQQQKIVIYGDYDADGICATAILWQALHAAGAQVTPFIPRRDVHGYGLSEKGIAELVETLHPDLIITVDNGIVALPALRLAHSHGIGVIVSDHHQPEIDKRLRAEVQQLTQAIVHTTQLCGAGVAWFLAREFSQEEALRGLDLVAIATIADQVPLLQWNRACAVHGLSALRQTKRVGLLALADRAELNLTEVTERSVGFTLAPRINAMGRLAHGLDALRLLCTSSNERAYKLASVLGQTNTDRQEMTQTQFDTALALAQDQLNQSVIVVAHADFHEGVVGLIAGRLTEQLHKPALVLTITDSFIKGSARSIPGVNIVSLLRQVREHLIDVGGHPMAAGFSLHTSMLTVFSQAVQAAARETVSTESLEHSLEVECEIEASLISLATARELERLAPFGTANPEPLFVCKNLEIAGLRSFGRDQQHLGVEFRLAHAQVAAGVFWRQAELRESLQSTQRVDCIFKISESRWRNTSSLQLVIEDIQPSTDE